MRDITAPESFRWRRFVDVFEHTVGLAGYDLVIPPLLEDIGVFTRLGEATDVVTKEMYDFVDKGERHVALRPEQTASICRSFVEHRPTTPFKAWYAGPNFRYEKPQRGRYRQFDQVGIEVLGSLDPYVDIEVIQLGWTFFAALGLRNVELAINSLGTPDDRARYVAALHDYFESRNADLSPESQQTLLRNPLRVLDSKRSQDAPVIAEAPLINSYWCSEATEHFEVVCEGLDAVGVPYTLDLKLVRGLDYYRGTTFEYRGGTLDSAQNALGGGGRYDGLVADLGGPDTPGVGFAIGLDRTLLACDDENVFPAPSQNADVFVVDVGNGSDALSVCAELRAGGIRAERSWDQRSMKAQMKAANRSGARFAVIIGESEREAGTALIRDLRSDEEQLSVARADLTGTLMTRLSSLQGASS